MSEHGEDFPFFVSGFLGFVMVGVVVRVNFAVDVEVLCGGSGWCGGS